MKTSPRKLICFLSIGFASAVAGCDCAVGQSPKLDAPASNTKASKPTRTVTVPATVLGYSSADLYSKVGGFVSEIKVDIGDKVEAGDVLAKLDIPETALRLAQKESLILQAEAERSQALARVDEAKARLESFDAHVKQAETMQAAKEALFRFRKTECERLQRLAASGAVQRELVDSATYEMQAAQADMQTAKAGVATANADLVGARAGIRRAEADGVASESQIAVAQANLDYEKQLSEYATLRAPWKGEVTKRMFDEGAFVQGAAGNSAAKPVLTVVRVDKVRVKFALSMGDIATLKRGDRVVLSRIAGMPDKEFVGEVSRFSAGLNPKSRSLDVEMVLDNADGFLKPGYFGYVTVSLE